MLLIKLFRRAAYFLAVLAAIAGIVALSGCGKFIQPGHETPGTDTPGTETPGENTPGQDTPGTDDPGEEPDEPGTDTPGGETEEPDSPSEPSGFTLLFGDEAQFYPGEAGEFTLSAEGHHMFQVLCDTEFSLNVVSNIPEPYSYTAGGINYSFSDDDYTSLFIDYFVNSPDRFYIPCEPGKFELKNVLATLRATDDLVLNVPAAVEYPYKLVVTSESGETITVLLNQA